MSDDSTPRVPRCYGCAEDVEAEYHWHDGMYRSYYCRDHVEEMLPKDRTERRDCVVSGFATRLDSGEKLVVKDDLK